MLHTLNVYNVICQLYLNKAEKKEIRALGALRKEQELEKASWRMENWS